MELQNIKDECVKKWQSDFGVDKRIQFAIETFDLWFSQIPDEYKEISLVLLKNLDYYSKGHTNKLLIELHNSLSKLPTIADNNTIYAYIKSKDGKTNSSNDYWAMYKMLNDINLEYAYENIFAIDESGWNYVDNIVFIDDFSGTGKSFIKELEKCERRYKNKNIYFLTISIMENAIKKISEYAERTGSNIIPVYIIVQQKVFERDFFKNNEEAKKLFLELSRKLNIPSNQNHLGFKNTESLVAFHNNTPNNTIALIRYESDAYKSLFPRVHAEKPPWDKMKTERKSRKATNYNNKSK